MSCLFFQQHFLPLFLGNDVSLADHQIYQNFKEEFALLSASATRKGKGPKSNATKKLFKEIKKIVRSKTSPRTLFDEDEDDETLEGNGDGDGDGELTDLKGWHVTNRTKSGFRLHGKDDDDKELDYSYPYEDEELQDDQQNDEEHLDTHDGDAAEWSEEDEGDLRAGKDGEGKHEKVTGNATLKEVQNAIADSPIHTVNYKVSRRVTIILTNGTIIHVWIKNIFAHDYVYTINPILQFDELVSSIAYGQTHVLFLFPDNRLVVARKFVPVVPNDGSGEETQRRMRKGRTDKRRGHGNGNGKAEAGEIRVSTYKNFMPPASAKKPNKRVVLSDTLQLFMIWWSSSKDEVFTWTPKPEERANILIYSLAEYEPELQFFAKTEHTLSDAYFIDRKDETIEILVLETYSSSDAGQLIAVETAYQVKEGSSNKYRNEIHFPVHSSIICHDYNQSYTQLGVGCSDRTIGLHLREGQITRTVKCSFSPTAVSWHPHSQLLIVFGGQGQFQMYDIGLTPLLLCPVANSPATPSMTQQLVPAAPIQKLVWAPFHAKNRNNNGCYLLIQFQNGDQSIGLLRLTLGSMRLSNLVNFYLTDQNTTAAIKLLKSVQWNSEQCLHSMYAILGELIVKDYAENVEGQLEELLAIFFVPSYPPDEYTRKKHMRSVCLLAKKFFMWLIRAGKLERALQIAVSLKDRKLLRHIRQVGETLNNQQLLEHPDLKNVCASQTSDDDSSKTDDESSDSHSDDDASFSSSYSCPHGDDESCTCSEWGSSSPSSYSSYSTSSEHGSKSSSKYSSQQNLPSVRNIDLGQAQVAQVGRPFEYQDQGPYRVANAVHVHADAPGIRGQEKENNSSAPSAPSNASGSSRTSSSKNIIVVHLGSV